MKIFICIMLLIILCSCNSGNVGKVKSGEVKHVPWTNNIVVGTDSTLVIIERETGKTLNIIKRNGE